MSLSLFNPWVILGAVASIAISFGGGFAVGLKQADIKIERYEAQVKELEAEIAKKTSKVNERVVTEYIDRIRPIKEREYVYVNEANQSVPNQRNMSNGWVSLHDDAAANRDADTARSSDETPSNVRDNQALAVVVSNYSRCHQNYTQLVSLQDWVKKTEQEVNGK